MVSDAAILTAKRCIRETVVEGVLWMRLTISVVSLRVYELLLLPPRRAEKACLSGMGKLAYSLHLTVTLPSHVENPRPGDS